MHPTQQGYYLRGRMSHMYNIRHHDSHVQCKRSCLTSTMYEVFEVGCPILHIWDKHPTQGLSYLYMWDVQKIRDMYKYERPVSHVFNPVQVRHVANTTTHLTGLVRCRHCNRLFNRALLQKRPTILRSLLFEATLYLSMNHTHTTQCTVQKEYRADLSNAYRDDIGTAWHSRTMT